MLHLTLAGLSGDNERLLLVSDSGEEFTLAIDARLRAALRGEYARLGQLEIQMESTLRPRDIQARIRAGETPEAVAAAAQTSIERILPFVNPVLAEREHVAQRAQRSSVRRKSGDQGARTLGDAVIAQLGSYNVTSDSVEWDAWRREDGRWTLLGAYTSAQRTGTGHFTFDMPGNYVTADDDDARWLVGEAVAPPAPTPRDDLERARRRRLAAEDEDELPLGDDALALVQPERVPEPVTEPVAARVELDPADTPAAVQREVPGPDRLPNTGEADLSSLPTVDLTETARLARAAGRVGLPPTPVEDESLSPTPEPLAAEPVVRHRPSAEPAAASETAEPEAADDEAPARKPARRKGRASVPSWDEIMFGGGKSE